MWLLSRANCAINGSPWSAHELRCELCRTHLGSFGVGGDLALQPMYTLSGGQKSRVAFARVTFEQPHILLLDEPSNHLDLDAVEALVMVCAPRS